MHEPRFKQGMGMGYAISPTGADHMQGMHDARSWDMGPNKVRSFIYRQYFSSFKNCAGVCVFLPYNQKRSVEVIEALTGWNVTDWELMKVGERSLNMARVFNLRSGITRADEIFPKRIHEEFTSGPLEGIGYGEEKLNNAISIYYDMMGWDRETGVPGRGKLMELDIEWAADLL